MSSEIQFGEMQQSQPRRALRPDQNKHYAVAHCRTNLASAAAADSAEPAAEPHPGGGELPIYVDLDVMRDMEAHAHSNTRVELGGVMLGYQYVDDQQQPFVVVVDCLRATHYEATKGSFKFTHDTWSQITKQRKQFDPELDMVGWYHTHPGWGIFLSGMDLFICSNFFNRPSDVALVIDPSAQQRGWFQWSLEGPAKTQLTSGFYLITHRFREQELNYFANLYRSEPDMNIDPRYAHSTFQSAQPIVNLMDNRRPILDLVLIGMLAVQFLVLIVIAWRTLGPNSMLADAGDRTDERIAAVEAQLQSSAAEQQSELRQQTYEQILQTMVTAQAAAPQLVKNLADTSEQNRLLTANLEGQLARVSLLESERNQLNDSWRAEAEKSNQLAQQLATAREALATSQQKYEQLVAATGQDLSPEDQSRWAWLYSPWLWYGAGSGLLAAVSGVIGFVLGGRKLLFAEASERTRRRSARNKSKPPVEPPE